MHELSLAMEVICLAEREAENHKAAVIREILIEVGDLSGVEADAFESALELIVPGTMLEGTDIKITRIAGMGKCISCNLEFDMRNRAGVCPQCNCFPSEISGGEEFRIVSMEIE